VAASSTVHDAIAAAVRTPGVADEMDAFLPLFFALLLFASATAALCLCGYFHVALTDLSDDLINPHTLCDRRVNPRLNIEFGLHAISAVVWLLAWQPVGLVLALPCLALRLKWRKALRCDTTTIFKESAQRGLRWRWSVMCGWHTVAVFIGFFQLIVHAVNALQRHIVRTNATESHPFYGGRHYPVYMHYAM